MTNQATTMAARDGRRDAVDVGEEAALWATLRDGADKDNDATAARAALFALYQSLARRIAHRQFRENARGDIELIDLVQLAHTGLIEAIDRFNPELGVPFKYYGNRRILGSILDGLSAMTERRAQSGARAAIRRERVRALKASHRPTPSSDVEAALAKLGAIAGELAIGFMLEDSGFLASPDAVAQETPYDSLVWRQMEHRLADELAALPSRERAVLTYHYLGAVSFARIAELLMLSTGRIAQLHKSGLGTLRKRLLKAGIAPVEK